MGTQLASSLAEFVGLRIGMHSAVSPAPRIPASNISLTIDEYPLISSRNQRANAPELIPVYTGCTSKISIVKREKGASLMEDTLTDQ
ncbi:hypothetical protein [Streptosporangium saharense]|uniref:Uncharacterized protein n=1 Tax=Streptosporangium saharense TaxID=1706840 RepID=A0A7W7VMY5_9ACTN|nr:hypothetical protein [Streptosporangium saharense]MBB4915690.1 hypothetical protein [Streptosporangium saharense]